MMETVTDRLTRYLLRRVRRQAVLDLYERASVAGLLEGRFIGNDDEGGTVWRVPHETLSMLPGDPEKDRLLIARRLGKSAPTTVDPDLLVFDIETNSEAALERPRPGSTSPAARRPGSRTSRRRRTILPQEFLAMLRQHLAPPNVVQMAVALLTARAVGSSIPDRSALRSVLSRPNPFVLIKVPTPGFERRFSLMLEAGLILPHRVKIEDVHRGASLADDCRSDRKAKPRRPLKALSGKGARAVKDVILSRYLSDAVIAGPVLVVDETPLAPSPCLAMTADVVFECAGLDHELLAELLHIAVGIAPKQSLLLMERMALDLESISLDDLALAIRPARKLEDILSILATLGERTRAHSEDEDDDGEGRRQTGRSGRDSRQKPTKEFSWKKGKQTPSSIDGVDIVQPVGETVDDAAAGSDAKSSDPTNATDRRRHDLKIETLSGYGEARDWAIDLKHDLKIWREGGLAWDAMSTKLLLSGPPGTGKTTYPKALCNTLHVPLMVTSVATWLEPGYLGDVLKRMASAFQTAREHSPAILFIDEIDNIGTRGSGRKEQHDDYWRSLINRLLELLDSASKTEGVIVVAATNLPDRIDPALLRSGRLEKHVEIPTPDLDALIGIFAHHLGTDLSAVVASAPTKPTVAMSVPQLPDLRQLSKDRSRADNHSLCGGLNNA